MKTKGLKFIILIHLLVVTSASDEGKINNTLGIEENKSLFYKKIQGTSYLFDKKKNLGNYFENIDSSEPNLGVRNTLVDTKKGLHNEYSVLNQLEHEIKHFDLGVSHTCVINFMDELYCWGDNQNGQLGTGDTTSPYDITTLQAVDLGLEKTPIDIQLGYGYTCVLLDTNDLVCFGSNDFGQLGIESTEKIGDNAGEMGNNLQAIDLGTGRKVIQFSCSNSHVCAVLDNDTIKCWGLNNFGQLGLEHTDFMGDGPGEMGNNLPSVDLGTGVIPLGVYCGDQYTCAHLNVGVKCWGLGGYGTLGYGDESNRGDATSTMGNNLPLVDVGGTVKQLSTGVQMVCVVLDDDNIKCWGINTEGALGYGDMISRGIASDQMGDKLPTITLGIGQSVNKVSTGFGHVCALLNDNNLKCWGFNQECSLGLGDADNRGANENEMGDFLPYVDLGPGVIADVKTFAFLTCALFDDHSLTCWGSNGPGSQNVGCDPSDMGPKLTRLQVNKVITQAPSFSPSTSYSPSSSPSIFVCEDNTITVEVTTDLDPYFTTWFLKDTRLDVVVMQAPHGYYQKQNNRYEHKYCAEEGTIEFQIEHDLPEWYGGYKLLVNETVVEEDKPNGYFYQQVNIISFCKDDSQCNDGDNCKLGTCDSKTGKCEFKYSFSDECRTHGDAKALVVKVLSNDSSTTASKNELALSFFGAEDFTMKSQFTACSFGNFNIEPYSGSTATNFDIENGVIEIQIDIDAKGKGAGNVATKVLEEAEMLLGELSSQFDFVIFCLPPETLVGTSMNWVAYAFVNSYLSIYNDRSCLYPSVQMHELGHNMGLSHSNDHENYGDTTGMMGISSHIENGPIKCFNAPKSFQLGWYLNSYMIIDIEDILMSEAELVGITDYEIRGYRSTQIKIINCQNGHDYFVSFNRNNNMNSGTGEGENQVLISRRSVGNYYDDSTLIAKLGHLQKFTIYDLGPKGDWNLQIIPNIFLSMYPSYTRISFLKWNAFCSVAKSCDDNNLCTTDTCSEEFHNSGCINTPVSHCDDCGTSLNLKVTTNDIPDELTWSILNFDTQRIVKSSITYTDKHTFYLYDGCFEYGRYKFSILYAENATKSNSNATFNLTVGDHLIDTGIISKLLYSEVIFTICLEHKDCYDYDGCTVDFCDTEMRLCNNTVMDSEEDCQSCSWTSISIITDNFSEETAWNIMDYNEGFLVLSGEPEPIYVLSFGTSKSGRRKAPTKSGRSKAPTRASAVLNSVLSESDHIDESICLEHNIKYRFLITDSFGDGICCGEGQGSFSLAIFSKTVLSGGNFSTYEDIMFKFSSESECEDNDFGTKITFDQETSTCFYTAIPCEEYGALVEVTVSSDIYADDTSWNILQGSKIVLKRDNYETAFATFVDAKCLPFGSYTFKISDSQENGMVFCFDHDCGYTIKVNNKTVIESDGSFDTERSHVFGICETNEQCEDNDSCTLDLCDNVEKVCKFIKQCSLCNLTSLSVDVRTDELFSLTSWNLLNYSTYKIILSGGPYVKSFHHYTDEHCITTGNFIFSMKNSEGRGMTLCEGSSCGYGVTVKNNLVLEGDGSFGYEENRVFGICQHDFECDDDDDCTRDSCYFEQGSCRYEQLSCSSCNKKNITVQIHTDSHSREISYSLFSTDNNFSHFQGGPFASGYTVYQQSYCVIEGNYILDVQDSAGNGFNDCTIEGKKCGYSVLVNDKTIIESDGSFLRNKSHQISFCGNASIPCNDNNECTRDICNSKTMVCEFTIVCWECDQHTVTVEVRTNNNAANTAWFISRERQILHTGGPFARLHKTYKDTICLSYGDHDFDVLYRGSEAAASTLSEIEAGYKIAINGNTVLENNGFESKTHSFGKPLEDWQIDLSSVDFMKDEEIQLKYFFPKTLNHEQFVSNIYDSTCNEKMNETSIFVSNTYHIRNINKTIDRGITYVSLLYKSLQNTSFWRTISNQSALVAFCVKSELLLSGNSNLSVSFLETKIHLYIRFASSFNINSVQLLQNDASEIMKNSIPNVIACICNEYLDCALKPNIKQNAEFFICVKAESDAFGVKMFESLNFFQNGLLKFSPLKGGVDSPLAKSYISESIGVVRSRLPSSFFFNKYPSDVLISGTVVLHLTRGRLLRNELNTDISGKNMKSTQGDVNFELFVSLNQHSKSDTKYLQYSCLTVLTLYITYYLFNRKKESRYLPLMQL